MKETRVVVRANAENLIDKIIKEQKLTCYCLIKVMADRRKGFLKICVIFFPKIMKIIYTTMKVGQKVDCLDQNMKQN